MDNRINSGGISEARKMGTRLWKRRIRKFFNNRLAVLGLAIIVLFVASVLLADVITEYDPLKPDFGARMDGPSKEHLMGTDSMGRDMFSRLLYGGRISILIALCSSLIGSGIGLLLGATGGYFGGWIDVLLVRLSEVFNCLPQLIVVMVVMAFTGPGTFNLILIFALTGWTGTFRLVRAEYISRKEETYVKVCEAFGMSKAKIVFGQILPSVMTTVVVQITMNIPGYIMTEAGLSFLGFGVPMTTSTWGTMLNAAKATKILLYSPHVWMVPGIAICLFVIAVNFFGDGLRDVMDPRQQ